MILEETIVEITLKLDPKIYRKHMWYKNMANRCYETGSNSIPTIHVVAKARETKVIYKTKKYPIVDTSSSATIMEATI